MLLKREGRVAQLGERLPYTQKVTGSSPVSPTELTRSVTLSPPEAGEGSHTSLKREILQLTLQNDYIYGDVAQWIKAPDCRSGDRGFESHRPRYLDCHCEERVATWQSQRSEGLPHSLCSFAMTSIPINEKKLQRKREKKIYSGEHPFFHSLSKKEQKPREE